MSAPAREHPESSKTSIWAGLAEACWLAALILIPLVYNPHSLQGFQPNKVLFLRLLSAVLVGLGLATGLGGGKFAHHASAAFRSVWGKPLVVALISYAAACSVSTFLSFDRAVSFFGAPEHAFGLVTLFSGIVLLAAIATGVRREDQIERFVSAAIAASFPVALYAIAQRMGRDALFSKVIFDGRSASTLGHPIYLAGYLQMVFPLTLWRAWCRWSERRVGENGRGGLSWPFAGLVIVGLIQLAGFVSAESRGPLLALGFTLIFLAVTVSAYRRNWRFLKVAAIIGALAVGGLVALNLPNRTMERISERLGLKRFSAILPMKSGPEGFRTELWKQAPKVMLSNEPLPFPTGGVDPFHSLRPWVGYGLDTMPAVLARHYSIPVIAAPLENRFHNLVWDTWRSIGFAGLAAFLAFVELLFFKGFERFGWMQEARSRFLFWGLSVSGAVIGAAAFWAWEGVGFCGLGLVAGLVGGITAFPLVRALTGMCRGDERRDTMPLADGMLILAVLGALAGHLVDASFAFVTTGTFTLFVAYGGLLMALFAKGDAEAEDAALAQTAPRSAESGPVQAKAKPSSSCLDPVSGIPLPRRVFVCSALSSLVLVTLAFTFLNLVSQGEVSPLTVLYASLTKSAGYRASSFAVVLVFIPAWIGVTLLFAREAASGGRGFRVWRTFGASLVVSAVVFVLYSWLLATQIAGVGPVPKPGDGSAVALERCFAYERIAVTFVWVVLVLVGITALALAGRARWRWRPFALGAGCVALMLGGMWHLVANGLRADVAARWADTLLTVGNSAQSAAVFGRSVALNPDVPTYHRLLSHALSTLFEKTDGETFTKVITQSEAALLAARQRTRGLDPAGYELGCLYTYWAGRETDPDRQQELAGKAAKSLDEARTFQPGNALAWTQSAIVDSRFLGRPAEAASKSRTALDIIHTQNPLEWGDYYRDLCAAASEPGIKGAYAERALERYAACISSAPDKPERLAQAHRGKAIVHGELNELGPALAAYIECLKRPIDGNTWRDEAMVAQIHQVQGRLAEALDHLTVAERHAPPDRKAALAQLQFLIRLQLPDGSK